MGMSGNDSFGTVVDRAYVLYDPIVRGDTSLADASVVLEGDVMFDGVGHPLAVPGDVDGDGRDDVLLSAASSDLVGRDAGLGYLFYGAIPPGTYACARARATFIPEGPDGMAGASLAGGDVNRDGNGDIVCISGTGASILAGGEFEEVRQTVAAGLEHPWSLAFLPDGSLGRLRSAARPATSFRK